MNLCNESWEMLNFTINVMIVIRLCWDWFRLLLAQCHLFCLNQKRIIILFCRLCELHRIGLEFRAIISLIIAVRFI